MCASNKTTVNSHLHRKCDHCRTNFEKVKFQEGCFRKIKIKWYKYFPGSQYFCIHCSNFGKLLILTLCNRKKENVLCAKSETLCSQISTQTIFQLNRPSPEKFEK
jgi:hypothetical protein